MLGRGADAGKGEEGAHPGKGNSDKVAGAKVCGHRWGVDQLEPGAGRGKMASESRGATVISNCKV